MDSFNTVLGNIDELPGPSRQVNMNTRFRLLVLSFLDPFERALNNSARETLKRVRQRFHSTAIATEQKELFGYGDKSSKCSKGKTSFPLDKAILLPCILQSRSCSSF